MKQLYTLYENREMYYSEVMDNVDKGDYWDICYWKELPDGVDNFGGKWNKVGSRDILHIPLVLCGWEN